MKEFFSNPGYTTIIAALIGAAVAIWVAVYNNRRKKKHSDNNIEIKNITNSEINNVTAEGSVAIKNVDKSIIEGGKYNGR